MKKVFAISGNKEYQPNNQPLKSNKIRDMIFDTLNLAKAEKRALDF